MSRFFLVINLLILAGIMGAAYSVFRDRQLDAGFDKITKGMSRDDVVHLMGWPTWNDSCGKHLGVIPLPTCVQEFGYGKSLTPWVPDYMLISFGADGTVTEATHIVLP